MFKNIVTIVVWILYAVLLTVCLYVIYSVFFAHKEKPRPADKYLIITYESVPCPDNWEDELKKLFNTKHTMCREEITVKGRTGYTQLITRKVHIDKNLSLTDQVLTYAHELTHLKYFTSNETFVTYQSIITLYESDIPYFRYVALKNVNTIVNYHSYHNTVYDCGYLLQLYFEKIFEECY